MTIGYVKRFQLTKSFNAALESGHILAAANIDAEFRDLVSDEKPEDQKEKSAKFRAEALAKFRVNYIACLRREYVLAHLHDSLNRAQEICNDLYELFPPDEQEKLEGELSTSIATPEFFRQKLGVIHEKFSQTQQADAAITSLSAMFEVIDEKIEKLNERYLRPELASKEPIKLERNAFAKLMGEIEEKIALYRKSPDAVPLGKSESIDVVLSERERLVITGYVEQYFLHILGDSKDSEQAKQVARDLCKYVEDNPTRQTFAGDHLNMLSRVDANKKAIIEAEPEFETISLVDENVVVPEVPEPEVLNDVDKYLSYMNNSFGRFFYQTRFLVSAHEFLKIVKIDALSEAQRLILNNIFSRAEFADLVESSKESNAKPAFKKLGEDLAGFRGEFNQRFNLMAPEPSAGSRVRIHYRNAFAIRRFSNYVASKTKQNVDKPSSTLGFRARVQLKNKFDRALKQGKLSKAAKLDARFNALIAHEEEKSRATKLAQFRKAINPEQYLDMLVVRYRHAMEAGEEVRGAQVAEEFVRLAPNKRKGELSATTVTIPFLKHEIDLLANEAVVFDAMDFSQKSPEDIAKEKQCLQTLIAKLTTLRERLETEGELLGENLLKSNDAESNDAESTPSPQKLMPIEPRKPARSPGVARLPEVSQKRVLKRYARVSQAQEAVQEHHLLGKAKVVTVERNPSYEQIMKVEKKIDKYEQQRQELFDHESSPKNNNNAVRLARPITPTVKYAFDSVLGAFSPKTMTRFFKQWRKPFDHQKFIGGLEAMATDLCAPQQGDGGEVKPLAIQERDDALTIGLINLFQQLEREDLEKLYGKVNHAMYKNFFRGLKYYTDWSGQVPVPNLVKLGFDEGNDSAQAFCLKLHNFNDLFIKALQSALKLKKIPFKDYFEDNEVVHHEGVYPVNQAFIRSYIQDSLQVELKQANSSSSQPALERVM